MTEKRWESGMELIMTLTEQVTSVTREKMKSPMRKTEYVNARRLFCYAVKEVYGKGFSLKEIGAMIGKRDHSTVLHLLDTMRDLAEVKDKRTLELVKEMHDRLKEVANGNTKRIDRDTFLMAVEEAYRQGVRDGAEIGPFEAITNSALNSWKIADRFDKIDVIYTLRDADPSKLINILG